jgi:hypothetical protein
MDQSTCNVCKNIIKTISVRYPKMICIDCHNRPDIKDSDGFNVYFANQSITGGFISIHSIDNKLVEKEDHICFIDGVKCYATEARFGGIVIQTLE